ncbi:MAG: tripartite tricarboxylate transporter substrate binding protein [Spirochaeta sp.]|jgi:tripartite-type tricarboxylate transporter receptor subunit TctC|nr:tripartite tricarboxylate transporter substrate binding protein [Spirochaeta sp.]
MKKTKKRAVRMAMMILALYVGVVGVASASGATEDPAEFPTRAISYVIPFNPGGQSDVTAQYQKSYLEDALGVDVVVRHQPGAGGALAWSNLTKADADGYTIAGNNIPHIIIQPIVRDDAGYTTDELKPVYLFQTTPIGVAVAPDSPFDTLEDLVDYAREHPGELTVSGSGTHTGHHLALLQLAHLSEADFTYIPATGAAPSVANFLGGHSRVLMANSTDLIAHLDEMKVLAIGTEERFGALPDVPTFIEEGYQMTAGIDRGVAAPPDTPDEIVARLEAAFEAVSTNPEFRREMEELGFVVHTIGAAEFAEYLDRKKEEIVTVLRELGEI